MRHISLLECLAEITQNAMDQNLSLPKYSLTTLYMLDDTVYKSGTLRKSVLLCPNVTNMELNMFEKHILEKTDLLSLLSPRKVHAPWNQKRWTTNTLAISRNNFLKDFFILMLHWLLSFFANPEYLSIYRCTANQSTENQKEKSVLETLKILRISLRCRLKTLLRFCFSPVFS